MTIRAAFAFALITAGCGRLDDSGLGDTDDLIDAAPGDAVAADAPLDTAVPDTAEAADSAVAAVDSAPEADAPGPAICNASDPDLIACYRFEDTEHAAQPWDDSRYAHHGTSSGVTFAAGKEGRAIVFDTSSYLNVPDPPTLGVTTAITIEAWIRPKSLPASNRAGIVDCNGRYGLFVLPDGTLRAMAPAVLDTAPIIKTGTWQHVAYTYDGSKQVLYLDGVAVKDNALTSGTFGTGDGAGLAIGMNSPSGDHFEGAIDTVRIYKVARTATQICRAAGTC